MNNLGSKQLPPLTYQRTMHRLRHLSLLLFLLAITPVTFAEGYAPPFELRELASNNIHRLSDYKGKVIYLDFWASWCGPCRQSLPALAKLQAEMNPDKFQVIAINVDENPNDGMAFLRKFPVNYTVLTERTGKTQRAYQLVGLPSSFLIDKKGEIIGSFQGFHPSHIPKLKKAIGYLLE